MIQRAYIAEQIIITTRCDPLDPRLIFPGQSHQNIYGFHQFLMDSSLKSIRNNFPQKNLSKLETSKLLDLLTR